MGLFSGIGTALGSMTPLGPVGGAIGGAIGGLIDRNEQRNINEDNANMQREFAQQGIRWRVADARAAGLHPLAVIGAAGASASPSYQVGDGGLGGQDVSRAMAATRTQEEREAQVRDFMLSKEAASDARVRASLAFETDQRLKQHEIQSLSIRNDTALIENEVARLKLFRLTHGGQSGPAMPSSVVGNVKVKPSEQTSSELGSGGSTEASVGGLGKPAMVPYRVGTDRLGFSLDIPTPNIGEGLEGMGPVGWPVGAALLGGHYGAKFLDWTNRKAAAGNAEVAALGPPRRGYRWVRDSSGLWHEVKR